MALSTPRINGRHALRENPNPWVVGGGALAIGALAGAAWYFSKKKDEKAEGDSSESSSSASGTQQASGPAVTKPKIPLQTFKPLVRPGALAANLVK